MALDLHWIWTVGVSLAGVRRGQTEASADMGVAMQQAVVRAGGVAGLAVLAALAGGGWFAVGAQGQDEESDRDLSAFMRLKLGHAQNVLEGLATEDFEQIAKGAQRLSLQARDEAWMVFQTEDYLRQSMEFQRIADTLLDAAHDENLDGAALAYVQLTMSCINCHKYTRDVRMASLR